MNRNGHNGQSIHGESLDPIAVNRMRQLVTNATLGIRQGLIGAAFDPRRDINDECGYPSGTNLDLSKLQELYDREAIAARVVQVLPRESWQVQPSIYEEEDSETVTAFEEAWDALGSALRGEASWYSEEEGSPVWEYLKRADELSGIGSYGAILLGLDDGLPLHEPAKGLEEKHSADSDAVKAGRQSAYPGLYEFSVNAAKTQGRKLRFLRVFGESLVQVASFEANPSSPRFGQPTAYTITLNDPKDNRGGAGFSSANFNVHWTRVIHVADNLGSSEVFGVPRMRPVLNRLLDLQKIYASDGEAFWKNVIMRIFLETHPQLGGDVEIDNESLRDMMENMENGLQRWASLAGMSAKTVAPAMTDPKPHIEVQIEAICIQLGIPVRIFKGSERGELASSQDDASWNDRLRARQRDYLTPRIIVPFVDRLIALGVLPAPKDGYRVEWPDLTSQSDAEKAEVAFKLTSAVSAYVQSGAMQMLPPFDFLTRVLGWEEETVQSILDAAMKAAEEEMSGDSGIASPLLGTVGGMTGTIDLFKAAKEGALSEEQLKQLLMLFFKLTAEQADAVIADGLTPGAEEAGMGMEAEIEKDKTLIDEGLKADPTEKEPPLPIKVKEGEKLVAPKPPFGG